MSGTGRILWRLLSYGRPHRRLLFTAFMAMVVLGAANGAYAWLMGPVLKFLLTGGEERSAVFGDAIPFLRDLDHGRVLWALPVVIVGLGVVKGIAYLAQFYWMGLYGQRVSIDLRRDLFTRLAHLSPLQLSAQRTGDLISRFGPDVTAVETAATYTVASWLRDTIQIVILGGVALSMHWPIALATLVILPIAAWPASRLTKSFLKRTREGQTGLGLMAAQVQEGLGGLRTVQAFNAQAAESARFAEQSRRQVRAHVRAAWTRGGVPSLMEILAAGALAGVLAFAAASKSVPPEQLVSLLTAIVLVYQPIKDLGRVTQFALSAAVSGERLYQVLDTVEAVPESGGIVLEPVRSSIRLQDVHFRWGDRAALRGVTLDLPVGQTTALVGPSGGGKSTLVALLLRFELPHSGQILIDGVDVKDAHAASVRRQFALVTQEPLLFSQSIRENIRFARPDASDAEVVAAAKVANADGFIQSLPQGYDTETGERGVRLSGGQKQRLCLARAVLANAPVLVLDEATSSLDPESEREVQDALQKVLRGRTALIIAHRLSTIVAADRIVVLEAGQVVETGTHGELLARGSLYASLWALQNAPGSREAHVA